MHIVLVQAGISLCSLEGKGRAGDYPAPYGQRPGWPDAEAPPTELAECLARTLPAQALAAAAA